MSPDTEALLIESLIVQFQKEPSGELHKFLATRLRLAREIEKSVRTVQEEIRQQERIREDYLEGARESLRRHQDKCEHDLTTFHGDPAGGFDSFNECQICGKHIK